MSGQSSTESFETYPHLKQKTLDEFGLGDSSVTPLQPQQPGVPKEINPDAGPHFSFKRKAEGFDGSYVAAWDSYKHASRGLLGLAFPPL